MNPCIAAFGGPVHLARGKLHGPSLLAFAWPCPLSLLGVQLNPCALGGCSFADHILWRQAACGLWAAPLKAAQWNHARSRMALSAGLCVRPNLWGCAAPHHGARPRNPLECLQFASPARRASPCIERASCGLVSWAQLGHGLGTRAALPKPAIWACHAARDCGQLVPDPRTAPLARRAHIAACPGVAGARRRGLGRPAGRHGCTSPNRPGCPPHGALAPILPRAAKGHPDSLACSIPCEIWHGIWRHPGALPAGFTHGWLANAGKLQRRLSATATCLSTTAPSAPTRCLGQLQAVHMLGMRAPLVRQARF